MKLKLLGEIFVAKGYCSLDDVTKALDVQKSFGGKIGSILNNMGVVTEEQFLTCLAEQLSLETLFDVEGVDLIETTCPSTILKKNKVFPYRQDDSHLYVLTVNPLNMSLFGLLGSYVGKVVSPVLTSEENLKRLLLQYESEDFDENRDQRIDLDDQVDKLKELASEAPVIKLVNNFLTKAVAQNASDIHFESLRKIMKVRFRVDGILHLVEQIPQGFKQAVIARLKIISSMNIAENRLPQDGRVSIRIAGKEIDIRASSVPTQFGESFVLRLLGKEQIDYSLQSLGFFSDHIEQIASIAKKTNGIFLTTGPTGSGKTTTLYSMLSELSSEDIKIITIEDPVEYEFSGVNQISIRPEIDFTFANALRSILRQDPDVIMVGEMRDLETIEISLQAALTGHLVFSTLHTNSALSSVTRLLDMGVDFFLLKATIIGIMAQRLVRKLCPNCACAVPLSSDVEKRYALSQLRERYPFVGYTPNKAVGCPKCNFTGYSGRTTIGELLPFDDHVRSLLEHKGAPHNISELGYRSMLEDGLLKALDGRTTIEEVLRVAQ